jgi:chromosome partitioning protein
MGKIIAITNQKGGVSKSTLTVNLGVGLARKGRKVLVIDSDSQGSLTASLGYQEPDRLEITLATVLGKIINEEKLEPEEGILHHAEGIDLMPANIELSGMEVSLVNIMSREYILKEYISMISDRYDYILIDCMPSLGMLTINALVCADSVIIPVQASYLPLKGLEQLIRTIGKVTRQLNRNLRIEGILISMVDSRTNYAKEICELITETYGSQIRIFSSRIPLSVRVAECPAEGVSIYRHDPRGKAAMAYEALTKEVLMMEESSHEKQ